MDQLSPTTLILAVLAIFVVLGFLKSFAAFFFNLIALAVAATAGLWAYNDGYPIANRVIDQPEPWMFTAIGITVFILTLVIIRKVLGFLSGKSSENSQTRSGGFGMTGAVFGLLLGAGITYLMLTGVRYAGTMSELDRLGKFISGQIDETSKDPLFAKMKTWIDESQIGQWHQKIDFLNDPAETNAAKLAIVQKDPEKFAQVTAEDGTENIPMALPVDPAIQEAYDRRNYAAILQNRASRDKLRRTLSDERLLTIDIERRLGLRK